MGFINRLTFYDNEDYNNNGLFIDLGINYNLPIFFRHSTQDGNFKTIENKIHKFNDFQGVFRVGYKAMALSLNYRFLDLSKNGYPSPPKFEFGISFEFE